MQRVRLGISMGTAALIVAAAFPAFGPAAVAATPPGTTGGAIPDMRGSGATQDPDWVALKEGYRIGVDASRQPIVLSTPLVGGGSMSALTVYSHQLVTSYTSKLVEPEGGNNFAEKDDASTSYVDRNYWNYCGPGAATAAFYYWNPTAVTNKAAGSFIEPTTATTRVSTYWDQSDSDFNGSYATNARNYLMWMAEYVDPPSYGTRGAICFTCSPVGAGLSDLRDALNWEASGENPNTWTNFFYYKVMPSGETSLHDKVGTDIVDWGLAVLVDVRTKYFDETPSPGQWEFLPNWTTSVDHSIAIVGIDDNASPPTYTYVDTCGKHCGSTSNGGTHVVSQHNMFQAIDELGFGIVW